MEDEKIFKVIDRANEDDSDTEYIKAENKEEARKILLNWLKLFGEEAYIDDWSIDELKEEYFLNERYERLKDY